MSQTFPTALRKEELANWKIPTKTLGVLGGMGPTAAADFLRLLAVMAPARIDQEHPKTLLLSNPQLPDRCSHILCGTEDPTPQIMEHLRELVAWGADLLAVPCNTVHLLLDRHADEIPAPLVHIVEVTLDECEAQSPQGAWVLATIATVESGLYDMAAERRGYTLRHPDEENQQLIEDSINAVKGNRIPESVDLLKKAIDSLWETERLTVAAACTEIPLSYELAGLPCEWMVSSLDALARECLRRLYEE